MSLRLGSCGLMIGVGEAWLVVPAWESLSLARRVMSSRNRASRSGGESRTGRWGVREEKGYVLCVLYRTAISFLGVGWLRCVHDVCMILVASVGMQISHTTLITGQAARSFQGKNDRRQVQKGVLLNEITF